jgi:23S rRNA (uridine2552-2'-O)-methyltransferase
MIEFASPHFTGAAPHFARGAKDMAEKRPRKNRFVKAWIDEHVNDHWVKEATRLGYRSRAAFKLIEIAERDRLFRPGMNVVDLGAAPGSWTQVLREKLGRRARIIALDILPMAPLAGVLVLQGDFREAPVLAELEAALGGRKVDLVVSDLARGGIGGSGAFRSPGRAGARICLPLDSTRRRSRGQGFSG